MKNKISLVLFTHNSEKKLNLNPDFLDIFDELIAVDDSSLDKTPSMLKKLGFKVFDIPFGDDFAARHNIAMEKAANDWVFFIDDDESPDKELIEWIGGANLGNISAYKINRKDIAWGKTINHGEQGKMLLARLVNKNTGKWTRKVHEFFEATGKIGEAQGTLIHNQELTVEKFLDKANFYSQIDALELLREGKKYSLVEMLKPKAKFVQNYLFRLGFLDGYRGLFLAYLMSIQSLLVRIYQWELQK